MFQLYIYLIFYFLNRISRVHCILLSEMIVHFLNNHSGNIYIVQRGDSLYSIARKFGTSVSEITRLNNLTGINLGVGQSLIIPGSSSGNTYIVQRGDSLYSIARMFNTSVDSIKRKNNLSSNLLNVGQSLII